MKSEILDPKVQTSKIHKFGDDLLHAIYFTATTSLPTLHLTKDLWKSTHSLHWSNTSAGPIWLG